MNYFMLLIIFILGSAKAHAEDQLSFKLSMVSDKCDEARLEIEIENNSLENVSLEGGHLPWINNIFGVSLIVQVVGPKQDILDQIYGIADSDSIIKIKSKEKIKGVVNLKERFLSFEPALKKNDLVLYWNYILKPVGGERKIYTGAILLTKCMN